MDPRLRTEGAPEDWTCSKEVGTWEKIISVEDLSKQIITGKADNLKNIV